MKPIVFSFEQKEKQEEKIDMAELMTLIDQQELDPEDVGPVKDIGGVD